MSKFATWIGAGIGAAVGVGVAMFVTKNMQGTSKIAVIVVVAVVMAVIGFFIGKALAKRATSGGIKIQSAKYGTTTTDIDVTEIVQEAIEQDGFIEATNENFTDPVVGTVKTLYLFYDTPDKDDVSFQATEGDKVTTEMLLDAGNL